MKKRKGLKTLAVLSAVFCLSGTAAAYFIYAGNLENSFTAGGNSIDITESYEPPKELEMGENKFKKKVQVENTGSVPCFVRVFAEFSDPDIRDISEISPDGKIYYPAAEYRYHLPEGWEYIDEDEDELLGHYYYCTQELAVNSRTPVLFNSVKTVIEDASFIKDYEIIVYAESVQTSDKDGNEFTGSRAWEDAWREFLTRR